MRLLADTVERLWHLGLGSRIIADLTGHNRSRVSYVARKLGLPVRDNKSLGPVIRALLPPELRAACEQLAQRP